MATAGRTRVAAKPARCVPDVDWEATKGNCRNLLPHAAVSECAFLSAQYRWMHRAKAPITVDLWQIIATLRAKKVPFVLMGAHAISIWTGRPHSTHDVDTLVKAGRNQARAVNALKALYPELEVRKFPGVVAFFVPGERESVIDVTYPHRADNEVTLQTALWVEHGDVRYRIPALEAALANKYGAMLTPNRDPAKRAIDAVDFAHMVRHSMEKGRQPIDLNKLAALGELVWTGGGGKEILGLVEQAESGQVPTLNPEE